MISPQPVILIHSIHSSLLVPRPTQTHDAHEQRYVSYILRDLLISLAARSVCYDDHDSPRASPGSGTPPLLVCRDKGGGKRKRDKDTKTRPRQDAQKPTVTQHDLDDLPPISYKYMYMYVPRLPVSK